MEYITSRRFLLPDTADAMANTFWFNMWLTRQWPYRELDSGNVLYWYQSPTKQLTWKSHVTEVDRFPYDNKVEAERVMRDRFGDFDTEQPYFVDAPEHGYCIAWKVLSLEQLDVTRPEGFRMPMLGWLRVDTVIAEKWSLPV